MEERLSDCETMRRENRRVAAMSWGAGDDNPPPPKPARAPILGKILKIYFFHRDRIILSSKFV